MEIKREDVTECNRISKVDTTTEENHKSMKKHVQESHREENSKLLLVEARVITKLSEGTTVDDTSEKTNLLNNYRLLLLKKTILNYML